jgi:hypothetical protein
MCRPDPNPGSGEVINSIRQERLDPTRLGVPPPPLLPLPPKTLLFFNYLKNKKFFVIQVSKKKKCREFV